MLRKSIFQSITVTALILWAFSVFGKTPITDVTLNVAFYDAGYLYHNGRGIDRDIIDEINQDHLHQIFLTLLILGYSRGLTILRLI